MGRDNKRLVDMQLCFRTRYPSKVVSKFVAFARQIYQLENERGTRE